MSYPCGKIFIDDFVSFISSPSPPGAPLRNLYAHYIKLICSILTYASPGWFLSPFLFLFSTHITSVKRMHRSSSRVIISCLLSTPIPLLHIEALLSPLCVILTHQSLSFFKRSLNHLHPFL